MSGIIGIYYLDGRPVDRRDLQKMVDILAHRGPDGADICVDGSIGFGHQMLWTTPESLTERLPLVKDNLIITADARIDNRDELKVVLNLPDRPVEKISDSEFILAAYEKWGEDCPKHLLGDFAFAIWDKREQKLFCARDHFGVKPFYYFVSKNTFVFGTEIKAILSSLDVPCRLNELKVAYYLTSATWDEVSTFYQNVIRLPSAHTLVVDCEGTQLRPYWKLDPSRELHLSSDEDYAVAFRTLFSEAVSCRLRSAFSVGSMLSGGLDSSSVACTAAHLLSKSGELTNQPIHTFSAIFPNLPQADLRKIDERRYINAVLEKGEFKAHYVEADRISPFADLDRVLWHLDEPIHAPNLFMCWALYQVANEHGVRVLMDGTDGDNTVSYGIYYLSELARTGRWLNLLKESRAFAKRFNRSTRKVILQHGIKPIFSQENYSLSIAPIVNKNFAKHLQLEEHVQAFTASQKKNIKTEREYHHLGLTTGNIPLVLDMVDKSAAAFSFEHRYPFLDKRLVEFCLSLPPNQKLRNGWVRYVLRRAMDGILPEQIQWRIGKANLSPNVDRGLIKFERDRLDKVILSHSEIIAEYVDISALRESYQRYLTHQTNAGDDAFTVWKVASLASWLHHCKLAT